MAGNSVIAFKIFPLACFRTATFFCRMYIDPLRPAQQRWGRESKYMRWQKKKEKPKEKGQREQEEVKSRSENQKNEVWTIDINTFTMLKHSFLRQDQVRSRNTHGASTVAPQWVPTKPYLGKSWKELWENYIDPSALTKLTQIKVK